MAFSEIELRRIGKVVGELCRRRSPAELGNELVVEYKVVGQDVLIYERRPQWDDPSKFAEMPVAKLRFVTSRNIWQLYWQRASSKWVAYQPYPEDKDLAALVNVIDKDELSCFFG
jgi:hypothetical protein